MTVGVETTARQVYILLRDAKKNHLTDKQVNAIAFGLLKILFEKEKV